MLMPSWGQSGSPLSKKQSAGRPSAANQRASFALRTNQPSPSGTSPAPVSSKGASLTMRGSVQLPLCDPGGTNGACTRRYGTRLSGGYDGGSDLVPRVARRLVGRALLAPQGLHPDLHDR